MKNESDQINWTILDLPVYILRILLSFLDATTLYHMSQTCTYLRDCIEDPLFWKYIDARKLPNTTLKLLYCTQKIHENTTHVFFGAKSGHGRIPPNFFEKIRPFDNLNILSLEFQKLNGFGITLKNFPACLEELSLKGTILKMRDSVSFFQHSSANMTKLKVLILDNCTWLTCSFLISVAKYESLEIISVVNCPRIHLHTVPYLNVAKYGLKRLKIFDCRFTGIGAELLHTFYSKESIQKFYFQSFNCAQVDYRMHFPGNSKLQQPSESYVDLQISDFSLSQYHDIKILSGTSNQITDSILYEDPYPDCTCGHREYHEDGAVLDCEISEEDIPISHVTRFICEKHLRDMKNLPDTFRDFCVSTQRDPSQDFDVMDDDESSDDDFSCCTFGTTSKMVIVQNINDPTRRQEIIIPGTSPKFSGRQMNIFIVNPLGERENALGHFENFANENIENVDVGVNVNRPPLEIEINMRVGNEHEGQDTVANVNEIGQNIGDESGENGNNENRENESRQEANMTCEQEVQENDNNENNINEINPNEVRKSPNLPGTSRGILENCLNENTENSRIEIARLQCETENKNDGHSKSESQKSDTVNLKGCDDKLEVENSLKDLKNAKDKEQVFKINNPNVHGNSSTSTGDYIVIERSLFPSTSGGSSNEPSCSGTYQNKKNNSAGYKNNHEENNTKKYHLKRKNEYDKDSSSSDDDSNQSKKHVYKVLVLEKRTDHSASTSTSRFSDGNVSTSTTIKPPDILVTDQPSSSGCHRGNEDDHDSYSRKIKRCAIMPIFDLLSTPEMHSSSGSTSGESSRERVVLAERNERIIQDVPEINLEANGNPFRVFRFNRTVGNAEHGRRINIRHFFPWPSQHIPPEGPRLRYRFPANEHKISLRCLSLRGYRRITDTTLNYIKHLNLELLDLTYTSVSREGIEKFLLENLNCRIIHQNYCRCKPKNPF